LSHDVPCTLNYYIIKENDKEIKYSVIVDVPACLLFYYRKDMMPVSTIRIEHNHW